jgi:hypothetical protein
MEIFFRILPELLPAVFAAKVVGLASVFQGEIRIRVGGDHAADRVSVFPGFAGPATRFRRSGVVHFFKCPFLPRVAIKMRKHSSLLGLTKTISRAPAIKARAKRTAKHQLLGV